jgi:serine/threonine-protein kinase RsbT
MSADLVRRVETETDARRVVLESTEYAQTAGFDETQSRMIGTAVSELARNILKYAFRGEIRLSRVKGRRGRGLEIEAADRGPGIADLEGAMQDHVSTSGTLGLGLPGVKRLMDEFSLQSVPGEGTRVTATKWLRTGRGL